jgi:DNA repair protein RadA/Sms
VARARATSQYVCQTCAAAFPRWEGQCRSCGAWNSLVETLVRAPASGRAAAGRSQPAGLAAPAQPVPLGSLQALQTGRRRSGIAEVDRVLGGGFVPGSVLLLAGEPGIGKSTLVLQVAASVAAGETGATPADEARGTILYASAEESAGQLFLRASRLGLASGAAGESLSVLASTDVEAIIEAASRQRPGLLIVDSIQTVSLDELEGPAGSVGQVRESAARLGSFARGEGVPVLLIGHLTKDGSLAGPRALEHLVDAVLMLEGDRYGSLRLLRALKNRHGSTEEVGVLEMTGDGLHEVADTAAAFLGGGQRAAPGVAVAAVLEGSRPLFAEVQALVAQAGMGPPRRTVSGIDVNRLVLLIAVLGRRGGIDVSGRDVYASLAGGLSVDEPALDLPLALAVASSWHDRPIAADSIAMGEVSLLGEVRPVPGLARRLREAARLGFRRALVPADSDKHGVPVAGRAFEASGRAKPPGLGAPLEDPASALELVPVATLREAIEQSIGVAGATTGQAVGEARFW